MATNYTGNPAATQSPSPPPGTGQALVSTMPASGDGFSVTAWNQEIKALTDAATRNELLLRSSGMYIYDDFLGSALSSAVWGSTGGGSVSIVDSSSHQGNGDAQISVTTATEAFGTYVTTYISNDFYFGTMLRFAGSSSNTKLFIGLLDSISSPANGYGFTCSQSYGNNHWYGLVHGSKTDLGVSAFSSSYCLLECYRINNGNVVFAINGSQVASVANSAITGISPVAWLQDLVSSGTVGIDFIKMWYAR